MIIVEPGDLIVDPMINEIRQVDHQEGTTVFMVDGGFMGIDEIEDVFLPGEELPALLQDQMS
jgi:hypothetical protein